MYTPLPDDVMQYYHHRGLSILAKNECEHLLDDKKDSCKFANEIISKFLKGDDPTWEIFYLANTSTIPVTGKILPGVVERSAVGKIVNDLRTLTVPNSSKGPRAVIRKKILHEPGSGATTIAKHVLWTLRNEMRCVLLDVKKLIDGDAINDKKLEFIADAILNIRKLGEEENVHKGKIPDFRCRPVLILLDNANEVIARALSSELQKCVSKQKLRYQRTLIHLLYLESRNDVSYSNSNEFPNPNGLPSNSSTSNDDSVHD